MTRYESTEHGFAIQYPEGWTAQPGQQGPRFLLSVLDPEGGLTAMISVEYKTDVMTLDDYVSEGKVYMEAMPHFELISEGPATIGEGISGYGIVGKGDIGTGKVQKFSFGIFVREKQGFSVGVMREPAVFDKSQDIVDAILGSFTLLPSHTYVPPIPSTGGTYTSVEQGFSIVYPAGWTEGLTGRPGEVTSFTGAEGLPTVIISVHHAGTGTTIAETGPGLSQDLAQIVPEYKLVSEGATKLDDGTPAYEIVYTGTGGGYNLTSKVVVVIRGTDAFDITGFSTTPRFEEHEAILDEVMLSFHLE